MILKWVFFSQTWPKFCFRCKTKWTSFWRRIPAAFPDAMSVWHQGQTGTHSRRST